MNFNDQQALRLIHVSEISHIVTTVFLLHIGVGSPFMSLFLCVMVPVWLSVNTLVLINVVLYARPG